MENLRRWKPSGGDGTSCSACRIITLFINASHSASLKRVTRRNMAKLKSRCILTDRSATRTKSSPQLQHKKAKSLQTRRFQQVLLVSVESRTPPQGTPRKHLQLGQIENFVCSMPQQWKVSGCAAAKEPPPTCVLLIAALQILPCPMLRAGGKYTGKYVRNDRGLKASSAAGHKVSPWNLHEKCSHASIIMTQTIYVIMRAK